MRGAIHFKLTIDLRIAAIAHFKRLTNQLRDLNVGLTTVSSLKPVGMMKPIICVPRKLARRKNEPIAVLQGNEILSVLYPDSMKSTLLV